MIQVSQLLIWAVRIPLPREVSELLTVIGAVVFFLVVLLFVVGKLSPDQSPLRMTAVAVLLLAAVVLIGFTMVDGFRNTFYSGCRDEDAYTELYQRSEKRPEEPKTPAGVRPGEKLKIGVSPSKPAYSINGLYRAKDLRVDLKVDNVEGKYRTFDRLPFSASDRPWGTTISVGRNADNQRVSVEMEVPLPSDGALHGTDGVLRVTGQVEYPVEPAVGEKGGVRERRFVVESSELATEQSLHFLSRAELEAHERARAKHKAALQPWEAWDEEKEVLNSQTEARFTRLKWAFRFAGLLCLGGIGWLYWRGKKNTERAIIHSQEGAGKEGSATKVAGSG